MCSAVRPPIYRNKRDTLNLKHAAPRISSFLLDSAASWTRLFSFGTRSLARSGSLRAGVSPESGARRRVSARLASRRRKTVCPASVYRISQTGLGRSTQDSPPWPDTARFSLAHLSLLRRYSAITLGGPIACGQVQCQIDRRSDANSKL
jgi:hypothetical protein